MKWELSQSETWPFTYNIVNEAGVTVVSQNVWAHSTRAKTIADVMEGVGFQEDREAAVASNAEQLKCLKLIAAAPALLEALTQLLAANDAVQNALCDGPDVPGWDRSALPRAQARVTEAEKVARLAIEQSQ